MKRTDADETVKSVSSHFCVDEKITALKTIMNFHQKLRREKKHVHRLHVYKLSICTMQIAHTHKHTHSQVADTFNSQIDKFCNA